MSRSCRSATGGAGIHKFMNARQQLSQATAKAQLEEMQTNLATAKQLNDGLQQMASSLGPIQENRGELERLLRETREPVLQ